MVLGADGCLRSDVMFDSHFQAGEAFGLVPAGLKALASLRLEKGYRDYGILDLGLILTMSCTLLSLTPPPRNVYRALLRVRVCTLHADRALATRYFARCTFSGHDIDNTDTLQEVGLGFTADFDKPGGFLGSEAVAKQKAEGIQPKRLLQVCDRQTPGPLASCSCPPPSPFDRFRPLWCMFGWG